MTGEVMVEMLTIKPSKGQSTSVYLHAMQRSCKDSKHIHHQMQPADGRPGAECVGRWREQ